jgi:F-type H+-transporting ATPase subunit gamma
MASIKDLRIQIGSLKNTSKITSAMKMVATSKLKRAKDLVVDNRPYSQKLMDILSRIMSGEESSHPLLAQREVRSAAVVVFTSDKGLCGGFNNQLLKFYDNQKSALLKGVNLKTWVVGRKGFEHIKKSDEGVQANLNADKISVQDVEKIAEELIELYLSEEIDAIYVVFNKFENVLKQNPFMSQVLPVPAVEEAEDTSSSLDYIYEPDTSEVLNSLIPLFVTTQLYQGHLEANVGEQAARMTAMDSATKNTKELISTKTLKMNRLRQAAITTELMEIIAGSESLKG